MWSFAHLTFQEYLCSAHWYETGEVKTWDLSRRLSFVSDSWWHETLRLFASQGDATLLVDACLLLDDHIPAISLAADMAEEARTIEPHVRNKLEIRLEQNFEATSPILRRQASEIYLFRRLKHSFQPIDSLREIDSSFVTCAEYQLFLDDMQKKGEYHHPKHWKGSRFTKGKAKAPISGVSFEEASAFCSWLTYRTGTQYRLPTEKEFKEFPIESPDILCSWTQRQNLMGLSSEQENEISRELSLLSILPVSPVLHAVNIIGIVHKHEAQFVQSIIQVLSVIPELSQKMTHAYNKEEQISIEIQERSHHISQILEKIDGYLQQKQETINTLNQKFEQCRQNLISAERDLVVAKKNLYKYWGSIGWKDWDHMTDKEYNTCSELYKKYSESKQLRESCRFEFATEETKHTAQTQAENKRIDELCSPLYKQVEDMKRRVAELERNRKRSTQYIKELKQQQQPHFEKNLASFIELVFRQQQENALSIAQLLKDISSFQGCSSINLKELGEVNQLLEEVRDTIRQEAHKKQLALFLAAIATIQTENFFEWRHAHYYLCQLVTEYIYEGSQMLETVDTAMQQQALVLYWYYTLILSRAEDKIAAWEGIRMVREYQGT